MLVKWIGQTHLQNPTFETTRIWMVTQVMKIFSPSYLSNGKKRKHDSSDEEDLDIVMNDSPDKSTQRNRLGNGSDDKMDTGNTAGSSRRPRQLHDKKKKRKNNDTDCESDTDSGEKEDVVMGETNEDRSKVLVFFSL